MKTIAIVALVVSIISLGLAGYALTQSRTNDGVTPAIRNTPSTWNEYFRQQENKAWEFKEGRDAYERLRCPPGAADC